MKLFTKIFWKKNKIAAGIVAFLVITGLLSGPTGLYQFIKSFFDPELLAKVDFDKSMSISASNTAAVFDAGMARVESKIQNEHDLDCAVGDLWENSNQDIKIKGNQIFLADGTAIGSIRFPTKVSDTFQLNLDFIPESVGKDGLGFIISVKDELSNELSITIGDGDYKSARYFYKEKGVVMHSGSTPISNIIKDKNISFQLATLGQPKGLAVSAFLVYPYKAEGGANLFANLLTDLKEIPTFAGYSVYLHLGLGRVDVGSVPMVRIAECKIQRLKRFYP